MPASIGRGALAVCLGFVSVVITVARADAQELLHERVGPEGLRRIAACGDVDGDEVPDLAVASPYLPGNGTTGWVGVLSGADLSILHEVWGRSFSLGGKWHVPEEIGRSLDGAGDFNGDGRNDVIIGSYAFETWLGRVLVIDGATGGRLFTAFGRCDCEALGYVVRGVGDIDADGFDDIAAADGLGNVVIWRGPLVV